jgi:hypothetical protein
LGAARSSDERAGAARNDRVARRRRGGCPTEGDRRPVPTSAIVGNAEQGVDIVPVKAVGQAAVKGGLTRDQARAVVGDYGDALLDALRLSLGVVALAALLSLWLMRRLPTELLAEGEV